MTGNLAMGSNKITGLAAGAAPSDAVRMDQAQPVDATLTGIAALGTAANKILYTTGVDTWAEAPLTAFARTILDDADATTARATLGAMPVATSAAAPGRLVAIYAPPNTAITLPAGGTWAYYWQGENISTGVSSNQGAGVNAGGTAVGGPFAGVQILGWAWRNN